MLRLPRRFCLSPKGATAIEYALISALIGTVIVTAVAALGSSVTALFQTLVSAF
jgi:Flp pilus assembly pilin Flp